MKGLPPKKQPADENRYQINFIKSDRQIHKNEQSPIPSNSDDPNEEEKGGDSEILFLFLKKNNI